MKISLKKICQDYFARQGIELEQDWKIKIKASLIRGEHIFQFVSKRHKIIIECADQSWTESGNPDRLKLPTWNEAMYFFRLAPKNYTKILFVKKSINKKSKKSLAEYYFESFMHLIPVNTKIWEYDISKKTHGEYSIFPLWVPTRR